MASLSTTKAPVGLQLDCAFVSPHDVLEVITDVLLCPKKALGFVGFPNELAI